MIKNILIVILFILLTKVSFAQTYRPIPESKVIWKVLFWDYSVFPCNLWEIRYYYLDGDTILNSYSYKKLYLKTDYLTCTHVNYPWGFYGGIRQDTLNKLVYYNLITFNHDSLLYDFNLHLNDTVNNPNLSPYTQTVDNIDSIQLTDGSYRKTFRLSPGGCGQDKLIEGIGSEAGIFEPIECAIGASSGLSCFGVDSIILYDAGITGIGDCNLINAVKEDEIYSEVLVYPNPGNGLFYFDLSQCNFMESVVQIVNAQGKEVLVIQEGKSIFPIDLSDFTSGIYLFRIVNEKEVLSGKLVFQKE
jgi:hypothetical protein